MPAAIAPAPASPRLLVDIRGAADMLGVSDRTLWGLTQPRGSIPCVRVSERCVRYSPAALEQWIEEQRETPQDQ